MSLDIDNICSYDGEIYFKKMTLNVEENNLKHIFVGQISHSKVNLFINKFFTHYPISFKFIFGSNVTPEEKKNIIKAGQEWSKHLYSYLDEPIVVKIRKDLLHKNSLAATGNYLICEKKYQKQINILRTLAINPRKEIKNLPSTAKFTIPENYSIKGYGYSLANLRALTNTKLKSLGITEDAEIVINLEKCFLKDFNLYSILLHELGHVLGFVSGLDEANESKLINLFTLDLYRFNKENVPKNEKEFSETIRSIIPNKCHHVFCNLHVNIEMSTGVSSDGDGFQASHWKENCGIMISCIGKSEELKITGNDIEAMMSLGYGNFLPIKNYNVKDASVAN